MVLRLKRLILRVKHLTLRVKQAFMTTMAYHRRVRVHKISKILPLI